ncbi:MAG: hypothetical protein EZS28_008328 [Streblomastix strix]|uniref:Uncharacterized protein n=1 Tax=Streblomastix strix TaxID=222440 RepID=A0A5J4WMX3_9EUKA|nr:MAG: hypothetical protein EZS28_008328 [Streblomastix strix]
MQSRFLLFFSAKLGKQPKQKFEISKAKQQKPIIEEPESYERYLGGEGEETPGKQSEKKKVKRLGFEKIE